MKLKSYCFVTSSKVHFLGGLDLFIFVYCLCDRAAEVSKWYFAWLYLSQNISHDARKVPKILKRDLNVNTELHLNLFYDEVYQNDNEAHWNKQQTPRSIFRFLSIHRKQRLTAVSREWRLWLKVSFQRVNSTTCPIVELQSLTKSCPVLNPFSVNQTQHDTSIWKTHYISPQFNHSAEMCKNSSRADRELLCPIKFHKALAKVAWLPDSLLNQLCSISAICCFIHFFFINSLNIVMPLRSSSVCVCVFFLVFCLERFNKYNGNIYFTTQSLKLKPLRDSDFMTMVRVSVQLY